MRNLLALVGLLTLLVGTGAASFFFGGYYNVSTLAYEPEIVRWALIKVRTASVTRLATEQPPPNFDTEANVRAGARSYFERGCVHCHGGPGVTWTKFSEGLRPDPPDLKDLAPARTPSELFWVIKNGINMTGMPGFGSSPDLELWNITAFLKKLPAVSEADFKAWSGAGAKP